MDSALTASRLAAAGFRAALLAALALAGGSARGQISPGELSRPHAELDASDRCLDCHSSKRGVDAARCLSCHAPVAGRIANGHGLHARADYRQCERCHIEHQGKAFELIFWPGGEKALDHSATGFRLVGAHLTLTCRTCHKAALVRDPKVTREAGSDRARTFLGLGTGCTSCHQDPHRDQFGATGCATCHDETTWRGASRFDHSKTSFPLTGGHGEVACARCHPGSAGPATAVRFRGVGQACASCHQDPHQRRFGNRCETCHGTVDWRQIDQQGFDHSKTRFPLAGRHTRVTCASCHLAGKPMKIAGFERCASCHRDGHGSQFAGRADGGECASCHGVAGFRPARFTVADHDATRYPLAGAHRAVACEKCHREEPVAELERKGVALRFSGPRPAALERYRFGTTACPDCHRDPHAGEPAVPAGAAACTGCHGLGRWNEVRFDHATTKWPLEGAHRPLGCRQCHEAKAPATKAGELRFSTAPKDCLGCHGDPHAGQLERPCAACHGTSNWWPKGFDHNRDARFSLDGAHRAVACVSCHSVESQAGRGVTRWRPVPRECRDCHDFEALR